MSFKNRGELAYETPRQEILDLRLEPDQMISENGICERSGVSRAPVRDALRLLQEQEFAETIPYHGTYVTLPSLDSIKQMICMRVAVKTIVLRGLLGTQTPMVMEDIRYSIAQQRAVTREPGFELEQFYRIGAQTRSIWPVAVRRQKLWEMLQTRQLRYTRFRMLNFITETGFMRITGEHEGLFRLVTDKDEKRLEEALKEHLCYSTKRMYRSIEVNYKDHSEEKDEEGRFVI